MSRSKWDQRIQRAEDLAAKHSFAAEVLQFYKGLAGLQKSLYYSLDEDGPKISVRSPVAFADDLDLDLLLPRFPKFLSDLKTIASRRIAESVTALKSQPADRWLELLVSGWERVSDFQPDASDSETLLTWLFLQTYAEYLADHTERARLSGTGAACPFCSGKPQVGVLRPEGDGAKRFLICSVCATEWAYGRIICPACGEEAVEKLAVYTASQFSHVRVEACDTCSNYIKTVDLTKNGHAVPVVDELATIPLNLWAHEHGYVKLRTNLLGM